MYTRLASAQLPLWNALKKHNVDPLPFFHKAQLDPTFMHKPGARYPVQRLKVLHIEVQEQVKDQCFGLSIGNAWHPSHVGILGYALLMSKSLRDTLERLVRFRKVLSESPGAYIHENQHKQTLSLIFENEDDTAEARPMREDAFLAWLMSVLRMNYQQDLSPTSVEFTHARPDCAGKFYEYFQSPIIFESKMCRLNLPLDIVDQTLPSGNEELVAFNDQLISKYLSSLNDPTLFTRVKKAIVEYLPTGNVSVEKVASDLFMSKRSLQRMLQKEDSSFIVLLNEARMELAKQYVADPDMDLTEVSFLLGFSEQSSFSRSFKRWTGTSPAQHRKAA
jgi:AraC-like DNA-binding protein